MRKANAFTLIELLVVIAIIALLVSILVPSLTRARDMARKAVCSTTISHHGKSIAIYLSLYDSYPHLSPWPHILSLPMTLPSGVPGVDQRAVYGWPKLYGVLEVNGFQGIAKTNWGNWYYGGPVDQVWDGCLCPALDAPALWAAADNAGDWGYPSNRLYWTSFHKWAVAYQWSPFLRAATPAGRYPPRLQEDKIATMWQWIVPWLRLRDGNGYYIQAISPDELSQASQIAEAWDSWDLDSTPNIPWLTAIQQRGAMTPGWHGGVVLSATKAYLNGARHNSPPNILYADGHVAADANLLIDPVKDPLVDWDPAYAGLRAYTWSNYDPRMFGNADNLIPNCEFVK